MTDKYEHPQPILSTDTDSLFIETRDVFKGQIAIKNTGGGVLKGRVFSRCKGLAFEPCEFEGSGTINYTFNAQTAGLGIGETMTSRFFISSNGGEKEVPVSAKLIKMSITTPDGYTIANIRDFYEYSLAHGAQARRLFTDSEFYMLLLATGYEYMEVYESLHKDANRERAMDNFFILSGLKGRTETEIISDKRFEFSQKPGINESIYGEFHVKKNGAGYVEAPLSLRDNASWLTLSSGKLTAADFNDANIATVSFTINPSKIESNFAREEIIFLQEKIEILYRRLPPLSLRLNRDTYRYADRGTIEVINNTDKSLTLSVFCPKDYIRFPARSFPIGALAQIPFDIKLSAFMNAQMLFKKLPYMKTAIEISTDSYKKTLPITVGEW